VSESSQALPQTKGTFADLARDTDVDDILAINRLEYGPDDVLVTREDFAWRHQQNPAGPAVIPVVRDAQEDVVAFISVLPLRTRVTGRDHLAATGTNLVIHPSHRGTLIYTQLMRKFHQVLRVQAIPFHYSFVSEATYQRRRDQDRKSVTTVPLLFKPVDRQVLAQRFFQHRWQRRLASGALSLAVPVFFRRRARDFPARLTIQTTATSAHELDAFWTTVRDKYPVMVIRDRDFLSWRFAPISGRRYHVLTARAGGQILGYAVLRCATIRGIRTGLVMDMLVNDGPQGRSAGAHLLIAVEAYFCAQRAAVVAAMMMPNTAEYQILRQMGYVRIPDRVAPRAFRFGVFTHSTDVDRSDAATANDWFVTFADYESF
jgi:uncharacterized protein (DUF2384 family)